MGSRKKFPTPRRQKAIAATMVNLGGISNEQGYFGGFGGLVDFG
jgi:hypothetical protein